MQRAKIERSVRRALPVYDNAPRSKIHKAIQTKNNTRTTALERDSINYQGVKVQIFILRPGVILNTKVYIKRSANLMDP